jgi:hypothetical protein
LVNTHKSRDLVVGIVVPSVTNSVELLAHVALPEALDGSQRSLLIVFEFTWLVDNTIILPLLARITTPKAIVRRIDRVNGLMVDLREINMIEFSIS